MTYSDIVNFIESLGLPFAYDHFMGTGQAPPFICFLFGYDDLHADNSNYVKKVILYIELYMDYKDMAQEAEIENRLSESGFSYSKDSQYIQSESMWQTTYTMEVILNAE